MRKILIVGAIVCSSATFAEDGNNDKPESWFNEVSSGKIFHLAQSITDKNTNTKPATVTWTSPSEGGDSVAVDAALSSAKGICGQGSWWCTPTVEYHKNTLIDKKTDSLAAGLVFNYDYLRPTGHGAFGLAYMLNLVYKDDRVKTGQGIQYGISAEIADMPEQAIRPNVAHDFIHGLPLLYRPVFGLQGAHANGLTTSSGDVYRGKVSLHLEGYPFCMDMLQIFQCPLQLNVDYSGWENISRTGPFADYPRYQKLFTAGLDYVLLKSVQGSDSVNNVAIGIDYKAGANPEIGQADQKYTELTLKLKF